MICTSRQSVIVQISAKTQFSLNGWHTPSFVSLQPMSPRPAQPSRGALTEKPRPNAPTTSGRGNGQSGKKMGWKEKWMGSSSLAMTETYQKFQRVEYMIWLAKVFGSVIIVGSGQIANLCPILSNRSFVQNECQGFLSFPRVVRACGLRLLSGQPLPGSAGLGSLDFPAS